jgi:hypothetical protein
VLGLIAAQLLTLTQTTFNMNKILSAFALVALALPAGATPTVREVINPNEQMVVVPGLEKIGPSRLSTVEFCTSVYNVQDWRQLTTDSELDGMWECLLEHT